METDATYFRRRAAEERTAAFKAAHPMARQRHLELAERYDDLRLAIEEREQLLALSAVGDSAAV